MATDPDTGVTYKRQRTGPLFAGYFNKIGLPGVKALDEDGNTLPGNPWGREQIRFDGDASQLYWPPDIFFIENSTLYLRTKKEDGTYSTRRIGIIDYRRFQINAQREDEFAFKVTHDSPPTITRNITGTHDGYFYSYYAADPQGGFSDDVTMELGQAGSFRVKWNNAWNQVCGKGWETGTYDRVINYWANHNPAGNSYMGAYGWTKEPLVEYYIVETWHPDFRPPGNAPLKGTVTTDGGTYDIYQTERVDKPSIIGNATFPQFWSVRQTKRTSGTFTMQNHFDAWASVGMNLGSVWDYQIVISEGFNSSGESLINVDSLDTITDLTVPNPLALTLGNNTGMVLDTRADFREPVRAREIETTDITAQLYSGEEVGVNKVGAQLIQGVTLEGEEINASVGVYAPELFANNQVVTEGQVNAGGDINAGGNLGVTGVGNFDSDVNINGGDLNANGAAPGGNINGRLINAGEQVSAPQLYANNTITSGGNINCVNADPDGTVNARILSATEQIQGPQAYVNNNTNTGSLIVRGGTELEGNVSLGTDPNKIGDLKSYVESLDTVITNLQTAIDNTNTKLRYAHQHKRMSQRAFSGMSTASDWIADNIGTSTNDTFSTEVQSYLYDQYNSGNTPQEENYLTVAIHGEMMYVHLEMYFKDGPTAVSFEMKPFQQIFGVQATPSGYMRSNVSFPGDTSTQNVHAWIGDTDGNRLNDVFCVEAPGGLEQPLSVFVWGEAKQTAKHGLTFAVFTDNKVIDQ